THMEMYNTDYVPGRQAAQTARSSATGNRTAPSSLCDESRIRRCRQSWFVHHGLYTCLQDSDENSRRSSGTKTISGTTGLRPSLLWWLAALDRSAASWGSTLRSTCCGRSSCSAPSPSAETGLRQPVEVIRSVANRVPVCIQELRRLLKDQRRRHAFGNGRIEDVEPVLVQIESDVGPRLVGISKLQLVPCHHVDVVEGIKCHFDARFLAVLRSRVLDRS